MLNKISELNSESGYKEDFLKGLLPELSPRGMSKSYPGEGRWERWARQVVRASSVGLHYKQLSVEKKEVGAGLARPCMSLEGVQTLFYRQQGTMERMGLMQRNDVDRCPWEGRFVIWSKIYFKNTQHNMETT